MLVHGAPTGGYPGMTNSWPCAIPDEPAYTGHPPFAYIRDCFDLSDYDGMDILIGFFFGSDTITIWYRHYRRPWWQHRK